MKLKKIEGVELIAENEFSKTFKLDAIDLFISKAYDDEQDKHYIVASIPRIAEVNAERVQFPFIFEDEEDRDNGFLKFDLHFAKTFIKHLIEMIKKQNEENKKKKQEEEQEDYDAIQIITEDEAKELDLPELREHNEKPQ
jgi:hypothetical protein